MTTQTWRRVCVSAVLLTFALLAAVPGSTAATATDPPTMPDYWAGRASADGTTVTLAFWSRPVLADGSGPERIELTIGEWRGAEPVHRTLVGDQETYEMSTEGLPVWRQLNIVGTAHFADGSAVDGHFGQVRVLPKITFPDQAPTIIKQGHSTNRPATEVVEHPFHLSGPLDVPLRIDIEVLAFGSDPSWYADTFVPLYATVRDVRPGETSGVVRISYEAKGVKRFNTASFSYRLTANSLEYIGNDAYYDLHDGRADVKDAYFTATIVDRDPPQVVIDADETVQAGRTARLRVNVVGRAQERTVVRYRTSDGSARAGRDYRATRGTIVIPRGGKYGWITVRTRARTSPGSRWFGIDLIGSDRTGSRDTTSRRGSTVRVVASR